MRNSWMLALMIAASLPAYPAEVGLVKVLHGSVTIQRGEERIAAAVGTPVQASDVIVTGADGAAGITFSDNSLVSVGPASVFAIDKYAFDTTTYAGEFQGTLSKGRLAAVSGKMVQQTPESMKIRTPSAIMGVRGTEFVVQVDEPVTQRP